ncbi:hypothetical protein FZEAL_4216 [Fusarium zealandicum]|uniref:RRM domain-containing protein n=1 Tax=Fusarium zealandicum TaxID=1053134 RepID=A0A8H4XL14_9HYPO|nr:hypothetical protein FZEAL_4216 [Fusarium zealandicum]
MPPPAPSTPDTQSSSDAANTPNSHPQENPRALATPGSHVQSSARGYDTPPTDILAMRSTDAYASQQGYLDSPSLIHSYWQQSGLNPAGIRAIDTTDNEQKLGNNRYSGDSTSTVVPRSQPPKQQSLGSLSFVRNGRNEEMQSDRPHPIPFTLQTPPPPHTPIRQPAAPPVSHNTSSGNRQFLDGLSPSPSIWQGLNSRFTHMRLDTQAASSSSSPVWTQPRETSESPQLPSWMNQALNQGHHPPSSLLSRSPTTLPPMQRSLSPPRGFRPMAAISHHQRPAERIMPREPDNDGPVAFSGNYRGEHSMRNASVEALAPELNCALWLTNLPPDVTHRQLLSQVRNVGRIWCTVINAPDWSRHTTAAAKVVFFTPAPAQLLLSKSLTQGLDVNGYKVKVTHNRVKYAEEPLIGNASRVLIVTGKTTFVNPESLTEFFKARFVFEVDEITELIVQGNLHTGGRSVIEYKFGSFRCQSQMGKMALEKDRPDGFEKVEFGPDPCEVGDTLASYGIAAERIQGRGI